MQANWSVVLNVLLLVGVIIAIGRLIKIRKQNVNPVLYQPSFESTEKRVRDTQAFGDDIIAVRKVDTMRVAELDTLDAYTPEPHPPLMAKPVKNLRQPQLFPDTETVEHNQEPISDTDVSTVMILLSAKGNRQFAGYELLQTVLATGLRFGEGHLFHRHQFTNGQGPVICSLAAATTTGIFDLQNIGAFSVRGLCLFMHSSQNAAIDAERFDIMMDTARQLADGLDALLLNEERKPLTDERLARYYQLLRIDQPEKDIA